MRCETAFSILMLLLTSCQLCFAFTPNDQTTIFTQIQTDKNLSHELSEELNTLQRTFLKNFAFISYAAQDKMEQNAGASKSFTAPEFQKMLLDTLNALNREKPLAYNDEQLLLLRKITDFNKQYLVSLKSFAEKMSASIQASKPSQFVELQFALNELNESTTKTYTNLSNELMEIFKIQAMSIVLKTTPNTTNTFTISVVDEDSFSALINFNSRLSELLKSSKAFKEIFDTHNYYYYWYPIL